MSCVVCCHASAVCPAGTYGEKCTACTAGSWCPGGKQAPINACGPNRFSLVGAKSPSDCFCVPGVLSVGLCRKQRQAGGAPAGDVRLFVGRPQSTICTVSHSHACCQLVKLSLMLTRCCACVCCTQDMAAPIAPCVMQVPSARESQQAPAPRVDPVRAAFQVPQHPSTASAQLVKAWCRLVMWRAPCALQTRSSPARWCQKQAPKQHCSQPAPPKTGCQPASNALMVASVWPAPPLSATAVSVHCSSSAVTPVL